MKSNLKEFRNDAGLSLQNLGDRCGMNKGLVFHMEGLDSNPTLTNAYKIAAVLDVKVEDIWPNETKVETVSSEIRKVKGC